jgi:hypothetical protein
MEKRDISIPLHVPVSGIGTLLVVERVLNFIPYRGVVI